MNQGGGMGAPHPARGEDGPQRHAGPEGDGLPDRMRGACNTSGQVAAECRQGVRVHRPLPLGHRV